MGVILCTVGFVSSAMAAVVVVDVTDGQVSTSGTWSTSSGYSCSGPFVQTTANGATATLTFDVASGTTAYVDVLVLRHPSGGSGSVLVDGVSAGPISFHQSSGTTCPAVGYTTLALSAGTHTVAVRKDSGVEAYVDGFRITDSLVATTTTSSTSSTSSTSTTSTTTTLPGSPSSVVVTAMPEPTQDEQEGWYLLVGLGAGTLGLVSSAVLYRIGSGR